MEKTITIGIIIMVLVMGAPNAYAQSIHSGHPLTDFKSGYAHGIADASDPCKDPCLAYVWKSPNGFINQTTDFINGYVTGFCKILGPDSGMDEPEADFDCNKGPSSAGWMIGKTITGTYTSVFPSRNLP
jgi:hypothetical protein